ncbi:MAG: C-terminal binding protein [Actinomycetes bacterium]
MTRRLIAVADGAITDLSWIRPLEAELGCELKFGSVETVEDVKQLTEGCEALLVSLHKLTAEKLRALPKSIQCVGRLGIGLDSIDLATARELELTVIYQPLYSIHEVANHALSMILALHRGLFSADKKVRSDGWAVATEIAEIISLQDATVGVIGCGRIGQAVIKRLTPFVGKILAYDPIPPKELVGAELTSDLHALLAQSQIVTLHAPYLPSTHHMIDAQAMSAMPKGSILVNVSRGGLVDESALAESLRSGHLSAAGLDVFEKEPLEADSPLRQAPNLVLTPHIAWYSKSSGPRLGQWGLADAFSFLESQEIKFGNYASGPY